MRPIAALRALMPGNALWMLYSYLVGFGLQGLYFVILARVLGPAQYGIFAGALAVASTFATLSGLGSGNVLVLRVARSTVVLRDQLGTAFLYIGGSAVPLALVSLVVGSFVGQDLIVVLVPLLLSELLFMRLLDLGYQVFQSVDRLRTTAHLNVIAAGARVVLVFGFSFIPHASASQWAWLYMLCNATLAIVVQLLVWRRYGGPRWSTESIATTWRDGTFFALGTGSRMVYTDGDKYVLNLFGMNAVAGEYSAAFRLVTMAFAPIQAIVYSANSRFFRAGLDGYRGVWPLLQRALLPIMVWSALGYLALLVGGKLLPLLLGAEYATSASMLPWLAPLLVIQALHYSFGDALMGVGRQWLRGSAQALVAIVSVGLNIWLVPDFGWRGSAAASLISGAALVLLVVLMFFVGYRRQTTASRTLQ